MYVCGKRCKGIYDYFLLVTTYFSSFESIASLNIAYRITYFSMRLEQGVLYMDALTYTRKHMYVFVCVLVCLLLYPMPTRICETGMLFRAYKLYVCLGVGVSLNCFPLQYSFIEMLLF